MGIKVPGSLGGLQYIEEESYGVLPSTDLKYLGFFNTMKDTSDRAVITMQADGNRSFDTSADGIRSAGYSGNIALFKIESPYDWTNVLTLANNPSGDLPSFSTLVKLASDQYVLYNGCKMDSVTLKADAPGSPISADVTVRAMRLNPQQSTRTGYAGIGAEATGPTKDTIIYNAYPTTNIEGVASIPAKSFSVTVSNNLSAQEGIVSNVALSAGNGLIPGKCEISAEFTVVSKDMDWDNRKLAGQHGFNISMTITGHTITLSGCTLEYEGTSRSQGTYDETIKVKAKTLTVV